MQNRKFKLQWQQKIWNAFYKEIKDGQTASIFNDTKLKLDTDKRLLDSLEAELVILKNKKNHKETLVLELVKLNKPFDQTELVKDIIEHGDQMPQKIEMIEKLTASIKEKTITLRSLKQFTDVKCRTYWEIMKASGMIKENYLEFALPIDELIF